MDLLEPAEKRQIVEDLCDRITVGKGEVEIHLRYLPFRASEDVATRQHDLARALPCCYRVLTAPKIPVPLPPTQTADLPARLRRLRDSLRLTRRAMAARLGFNAAAYLCWERGEKAPGLRALPGLLAALGEAPPGESASDSLPPRLKAWRLRHGLSQAEAAGLADIDPKTLRAIERGRRVCQRSAAAVLTLLQGAPPVSGSPGDPRPATS